MTRHLSVPPAHEESSSPSAAASPTTTSSSSGTAEPDSAPSAETHAAKVSVSDDAPVPTVGDLEATVVPDAGETVAVDEPVVADGIAEGPSVDADGIAEGPSVDADGSAEDAPADPGEDPPIATTAAAEPAEDASPAAEVSAPADDVPPVAAGAASAAAETAAAGNAGTADPSSTASVPRSAPPRPKALPRPSPWPARGRALLAVLAVFGRGIAWVWRRPKIRLALIGLCLLLLGGLVVTSSVWTLPLVIVGALMIVIAWVGSRLDGRFAVDWGEGGTQLEFRAKIKASPSPDGTPALHAGHEPADAEVIEGEAHTVEIDVNELKALIAAVEAEEARVHGGGLS